MGILEKPPFLRMARIQTSDSALEHQDLIHSNLSQQIRNFVWLVSFMDYDISYFDHETRRLEPIEKPFGPKVLRPLEPSAPRLIA